MSLVCHARSLPVRHVVIRGFEIMVRNNQAIGLVAIYHFVVFAFGL
jgi:hypothetical protein